ncbi:MAG: amidophosphoribosyltransferase [Oscillospiraceae bacterium]|nr:amidophosphoribosyltransferase [Oscillospiraceae bacterium]
MGGFFGAVANRDVVMDVFFGVDYHGHLGTRRAGMTAWDPDEGFQRSIHNIENTPFRTKFEGDVNDMHGTACIACISDLDPQPLVLHSRHGAYALCVIGCVNNMEQLKHEYLTICRGHLEAHSKGRVSMVEIIASMINGKESFAEGINFVQERVEGSATILICTEEGKLIVSRDRYGRLPVMIGKSEDGYCVAFESFSFNKMGYEDNGMLGPGECVEITADGITQLLAPRQEEKFCAFMWTYFGYPTSRYEGDSVELIRNRGGVEMAKFDMEHGLAEEIDAVCGVPDSGIPYAVGYANERMLPFTRPFIKYTPTWPRSFMPSSNRVRHHIAKMKMLAVSDLIKDKKLLFIDDSIVRGTQLQETVDFLYDNGAAEVHMRSACPPIMHACKYLNFSRSNSAMDLIARRVVRELEGEDGDKHLDEYSDGRTERGKALRCCICEKFGFTSLEYQTMEGLIKSIGLPKEKICTYCWTGEE